MEVKLHPFLGDPVRNFYERVLPSQGVYCVSGIDTKGRVLNLFAESLNELIEHIEELRSVEANVFVAPGSFQNHSRRAENSLFMRSFFIDLDVGDGKGYPDQPAAVEALDQFVTENNLPPPTRVNSGGGIHAYWVLDEDIPSATWKPYAKKFKAFCMDHGLRIDPVVTADAARIMRCPDTFNYKTDPPKPTSLIDQSIQIYSWESFKDFLGEVEPDVLDVLASVERGLDDQTRKFLEHDNFETSFQVIAEKSLTGSGCGQIKYILENGATQSYEEWRAGLSIARHCSDWETAIHLMSEDYPGYNAKATEEKANGTLGHPHKCTTFEGNWPSRCKGCSFYGKITNPLAIGRRMRESEIPAPESLAAFIAPVATDPFKSGPSKPQQTPLPKALFPYLRGPTSGGIYYHPMAETTKDGKVKQDPDIQLTPYDMFPIKRMFSNVDGECLMMRAVLPNDPNREFLLPMKDLYLPDRFKEAISRQGILFKSNPQIVSLLMNYVIEWGKFLIDSNSAEQMRMQMGWTEFNNSFVIGNTEITSEGKTVQTASSPFVRGIAKLLKPEGSYALWKEAANALNEPGFEMQAFGMLAGFGSPLMRFTSTSGVVICFTGPTGGAKTGTLQAALSIFGNSKELSVFDATDNGMVGRYLGLHSIMLGCDEVSNKRADQLSNLIHRISHGKAKIRMQASVNAERELEMSASLICFMTSNQSIYDKLTELKASPDGEVARLIEFIIRDPAPLKINPRRGKQIFDAFRLNYGFAGPDFVRHLFKVGEDSVKERVNRWGERFFKDFGEEVAYRFYENLIASTMAGGELAVEAGIMDMDIERIYTHIVREMISIRDNTIRVNSVDYKSLIGEFIDQNHSSVLILNNDKVTSEPRGQQLVARSEIHNKLLYVSKSEFKKYLAKLQISVKEFEFAMQAENILVGTKKQRLSTGWKAGLQFAPVAVYTFKYDEPDTASGAK